MAAQIRSSVFTWPIRPPPYVQVQYDTLQAATVASRDLRCASL